MKALGHDARRRMVVALASSLALLAVGAPSAFAVGNLNILAGNSETSAKIQMLEVGPQASFVTLNEVVGGVDHFLRTDQMLGGVPGGFGFAQLDLGNASCAQRDHKYHATAAGGLNATGDVRTRNCRRRFSLDVPASAAVGNVNAAVQDTFNLGGVAPQLCQTPPAGIESCQTLDPIAGVQNRAINMNTVGTWQVTVKFAPYESLTRAVEVGGGPAAARDNVVLYGDSIMSQLWIPLEDALPLSADVDENIDGGAGLLTNHSTIPNWITLANTKTTALDPSVSVVLLGGGDNSPLQPGNEVCCGAAWQTAYKAGVTDMVNALRAGGGKVVWVLNAAPGVANKVALLNAVEAAVRSAIGTIGDPDVSIVDLGDTLSPGNVYTDRITSAASQNKCVIVRAEDGLHLSVAGADIAGNQILPAMGQPQASLTLPPCVAPVTPPVIPPIITPPTIVKPKFTSGSPGTITTDKKGVFSVKKPKVSCAGFGGRCSVTTALTATFKVKKKRKTVKIGSSRFSVAAGKTGTIKIKLTKAGFTELKRAKKLKAKLKITVKRSGAKTATKTVTVTLKAPKKR